jgi:hypothetical protein
MRCRWPPEVRSLSLFSRAKQDLGNMEGPSQGVRHEAARTFMKTIPSLRAAFSNSGSAYYIVKGGIMTPNQTTKSWKRIPDGTRVRLRENAQEGVIDGLTELVIGPARNPDGRTQYRINLGDPERMLVSEDALLIVVDKEGLVFILKEKAEYRRLITEQLRGGFSADRFVPLN